MKKIELTEDEVETLKDLITDWDFGTAAKREMS